jgi:hypothetical protein
MIWTTGILSKESGHTLIIGHTFPVVYRDKNRVLPFWYVSHAGTPAAIKSLTKKVRNTHLHFSKTSYARETKNDEQ